VAATWQAGLVEGGLSLCGLGAPLSVALARVGKLDRSRLTLSVGLVKGTCHVALQVA